MKHVAVIELWLHGDKHSTTTSKPVNSSVATLRECLKSINTEYNSRSLEPTRSAWHCHQ